MDAELLSGIAGVVLSLAFSYIPGVKTWYDSLTGDMKRGVMALALLVVAGAIFGLACAEVSGLILVTCDQAGALEIVKAFIYALMANQATYLLTPRK